MSLVSVIIPVYNVEQYLRECVDSVIAQTYTDLEIIMVDDGSADASGSICDEYAAKDARIKVIHKENGGQSSARNAGLDVAIGKYVYFVDSDDYCVLTAIEESLAIIENDNAEFVFFDGECFCETNAARDVSGNYKRRGNYVSSSGVEMFASLIGNKEYHCHLALMLIRRELIEKYQLRFINGIIYEDEVFTYHLYALAKKVSYLNKSLYHHRIRENSTVTSRKRCKHFKSLCKVVETIAAFRFPEREQVETAVNGQLARFSLNVISCYRELDEQDRRQCKGEYSAFLASVVANNYYGSSSLLWKCKGNGYWLAYKIFHKLASLLQKVYKKV